MTSTASNAEREAVAEFLAGMEAVETVRARELWNLTEERAAEIIQSLGGFGIWREATDWSGLVTQQEILHRRRP
ncbi:MAG: hypothetical protein J0L84_08335 [Verrucomicrobia bacterium]|nr:hypothetical protein [Verrucomicrobiota bacterium]